MSTRSLTFIVVLVGLGFDVAKRVQSQRQRKLGRNLGLARSLCGLLRAFGPLSTAGAGRVQWFDVPGEMLHMAVEENVHGVDEPRHTSIGAQHPELAFKPRNVASRRHCGTPMRSVARGNRNPMARHKRQHGVGVELSDVRNLGPSVVQRIFGRVR